MIVLAILSQSTDGVPHRGVYQKISDTMGIHKSTIMCLWRTYGADANQALNKPAEFFCAGILGAGNVSIYSMMSSKPK